MKSAPPEQKLGSERFRSDGEALDENLKGFWQWSSSNLLDNTTRGVLAEYIVAMALGVGDGIRTEWESYDVQTRSGIKIEVKSAAYCQFWHQDAHSRISFDIEPKRALDPTTNTYSNEIKRRSDVYVFCLLRHKDKATIDPLNLDQWTFYVLSTQTLNEHSPTQKSISLSPLLKLSPLRVRFGEIKEAIESLNIEPEVKP